jgi:transposase
VPGGFSGPISPTKAQRILDQIHPSDAVTAARVELAEEILEDLRRNNRQRRELVKRIAQVVAASGTSVTDIYGVGPVVAAMAVSITGDIARMKIVNHFAAYNGTAPVEVSSGPQKIYRLSLRGNRQFNQAIHIAAVSQISHRTHPGRVYYDRKIAEGKGSKMALRALKRQISNALYRAMIADAQKRAGINAQGPGGQPRNGSDSSATGSHPEHRHFGQATPGPAPTLRPAAQPKPENPSHEPLDNKADSISSIR